MPLQSKAQFKKFHVLEAQKKLPPGTAQTWLEHTPGGLKALPEHKEDAKEAEASPLPLFAKMASPKWVQMARAGLLSPASTQRVARSMPLDKFRTIGPLGHGNQNLADHVIGNLGANAPVNLSRKLPLRVPKVPLQEHYQPLVEQSQRLEAIAPGATAKYVKATPKGVFQELDVADPTRSMAEVAATARNNKSTLQLAGVGDLHPGNFGPSGKAIDYSVADGSGRGAAGIDWDSPLVNGLPGSSLPNAYEGAGIPNSYLNMVRSKFGGGKIHQGPLVLPYREGMWPPTTAPKPYIAIKDLLASTNPASKPPVALLPTTSLPKPHVYAKEPILPKSRPARPGAFPGLNPGQPPAWPPRQPQPPLLSTKKGSLLQSWNTEVVPMGTMSRFEDIAAKLAAEFDHKCAMPCAFPSLISWEDVHAAADGGSRSTSADVHQNSAVERAEKDWSPGKTICPGGNLPSVAPIEKEAMGGGPLSPPGLFNLMKKRKSPGSHKQGPKPLSELSASPGLQSAAGIHSDGRSPSVTNLSAKVVERSATQPSHSGAGLPTKLRESYPLAINVPQKSASHNQLESGYLDQQACLDNGSLPSLQTSGAGRVAELIKLAMTDPQMLERLLDAAELGVSPQDFAKEAIDPATAGKAVNFLGKATGVVGKQAPSVLGNTAKMLPRTGSGLSMPRTTPLNIPPKSALPSAPKPAAGPAAPPVTAKPPIQPPPPAGGVPGGVGGGGGAKPPGAIPGAPAPAPVPAPVPSPLPRGQWGDYFRRYGQTGTTMDTGINALASGGGTLPFRALGRLGSQGSVGRGVANFAGDAVTAIPRYFGPAQAITWGRAALRGANAQFKHMPGMRRLGGAAGLGFTGLMSYGSGRGAIDKYMPGALPTPGQAVYAIGGGQETERGPQALADDFAETYKVPLKADVSKGVDIAGQAVEKVAPAVTRLVDDLRAGTAEGRPNKAQMDRIRADVGDEQFKSQFGQLQQLESGMNDAAAKAMQLGAGHPQYPQLLADFQQKQQAYQQAQTGFQNAYGKKFNQHHIRELYDQGPAVSKALGRGSDPGSLWDTPLSQQLQDSGRTREFEEALPLVQKQMADPSNVKFLGDFAKMSPAEQNLLREKHPPGTPVGNLIEMKEWMSDNVSRMGAERYGKYLGDPTKATPDQLAQQAASPDPKHPINQDAINNANQAYDQAAQGGDSSFVDISEPKETFLQRVLGMPAPAKMALALGFGLGLASMFAGNPMLGMAMMGLGAAAPMFMGTDYKQLFTGEQSTQPNMLERTVGRITGQQPVAPAAGNGPLPQQPSGISGVSMSGSRIPQMDGMQAIEKMQQLNASGKLPTHQVAAAVRSFSKPFLPNKAPLSSAIDSIIDDPEAMGAMMAVLSKPALARQMAPEQLKGYSDADLQMAQKNLRAYVATKARSAGYR